MKNCPNCNAEVDENYDLCWNCQFSFSENRIIQRTEFTEVCQHCKNEVDSTLDYCPNCQNKLGFNSINSDSKNYHRDLKIDCLRCKVPMQFKENLKLNDGNNFGVIGSLFDLLSTGNSFDLYLCPNCGKIEFFKPQD